jgi:hypothetical protein
VRKRDRRRIAAQPRFQKRRWWLRLYWYDEVIAFQPRSGPPDVVIEGV